MSATEDSPNRWDEALAPTPWRRRRANLRELFESISSNYDRLNRLLSLGLDERWRARTAKHAIAPDVAGWVLDLASGTGDLAVALMRRAPNAKVIRLDLSAELLERAEAKIAKDRKTCALVGEMEVIPLRAGSCVAVTMAYALRHVNDLEALMRSCASVLPVGGVVAFVDMALPDGGIWSGIYRFYFRRCLPRLAALLGGRREAYEFMVRSVESFRGWDELARSAESAGFVEARCFSLTGGAARIFTAHRGSSSA